MEPFDVLIMGNISDFHFDPSNLQFFSIFKIPEPLYKSEKNSSDYRVHGT